MANTYQCNKFYFIITMNIGLKSRPSSTIRRIEHCSTSRKNGREQGAIFFKKAKVQESQSKYLDALDNYIKATICDPNYFQAFCNMGACYRSLGKYLQAKNCYLRSLKINCEDSISHYNLANLYRIIGNYEQSINHYHYVMKQYEQTQRQSNILYINTLINIGICYKNLGKFEEAIATYEKVNELSPEEEGGYYNYAMSLLALIQKSAVKQVTNVDVERAQKVTQLFDKAQNLNRWNYMIKLARIKLSVLIDRRESNIAASILSLKGFLSTTGFDGLENEISEIIALCLGFKNINQNNLNIKRNNSQQKKASRPVTAQLPRSSRNLFQQFSGDNGQLNNYLEAHYLTEKQGINLIEKGEYQIVEDQLRNLNDKNSLKHTLQLLTYLHKSQNNQKFINKAYQVYIKYFTVNGQCLPFDQISHEAHKGIGKLLNLKMKYTQASVHFEYLSEKIRKNESSATEYSNLGEAFEEAGSMKRAIQEYRVAFQLQPKNQKVSYNLGCCLYENGHDKEALKYLNIFLDILKDKGQFVQGQKQLCQTQCYILIALASREDPKQLEAYREAFMKLIRLKNNQGQLQLEEGHLLQFFINFAELLEHEYLRLNHKSDKLPTLQNELIEAYEHLLLFGNCPDREQILFNAGSICYDSRQYLRAIGYFSEIKTVVSIPYEKISLSYLHIIEPAMTIKYIQIEVSINKNNPKSIFTKQVIQWIYYNENSDKINSRLPKVREDLFYQRNQYGIALIEKLELQIKTKNIQNNDDLLPIIQTLLSKPSKIPFIQQYKNIKFQKIASLLQNLKFQQIKNKNLISTDILKLCCNKSNNIKSDFKILIAYCNNLPSYGVQTKIVEALIYIFIYYNYQSSQIIKELLINHTKIQKSMYNINLSLIDDTIEEESSILPDFDNAKKLVCLLREWESVLTVKIQTIIAALQQIYYKSDIYESFELQYHFPRHYYFTECDETFEKMMYIILKIIQYDKKITCKGQNILEMKKDLISQFQYYFNNHIKTLKLKPINLSENFVPLTIYATHKSKQQSQKFVKQILTLSKAKVQFISFQSDQQYIVMINKLVRLRCRWSNPFDLKTIVFEVIQNIVEDPLYIVNQAVIGLQKLLYVISYYSEEGETFIKQDPTLNI